MLISDIPDVPIISTNCAQPENPVSSTSRNNNAFYLHSNLYLAKPSFARAVR